MYCNGKKHNINWNVIDSDINKTMDILGPRYIQNVSDVDLNQ